MNTAREAAYRIDPVLWVREILGLTPATWQETFLRAPQGASILALTARQVGKTTTVGNRPFHAVYGGVVIRHCLSRSTPECGNGAACTRGRYQGGR